MAVDLHAPAQVYCVTARAGLHAQGLHLRFRVPIRWQRYCLWLREGKQPPAWKSNAAFMVAYPIGSLRDADPLPHGFTPDPAKWWEMLSVKR